MTKRGLRLHPLSPIFDLVSSIRSLAFVIIAALLASGAGRTEVIIGVAVAAGAAMQAIRYFLTWYRLDASELVVSSGFIFRNERHVPLSRIQNLDLVRGPIHRMFNVAEVQVQTASGAEPEAVLRVLSMDAVAALRERIDGGEASEEQTAPDEETLVALDYEELFRLGLVSNRAMVVIGAALGILWQFDVTDGIRDWIEQFLPLLRGAGVWVQALGIAAGVVVVGVLLPTLSIAWTIVRFHGFTLTQRGGRFEINCGLFTKVTASIVRERVQLVSVRQSPFHRRLHRAAVRVETAGGAQDGDQLISRRWFAPIVPEDRVQSVIDAVLPGVSLEGIDWRPLAPKAGRRMLKKMLLSWLAFTLLASLFFNVIGLVGSLVILGPLIWYTLRAAKFMSYAREGRAIFFRSGVWIRSTTITLEDRIQIVSVSQSPFDRRHAHASVAIDTAGAGPAERKIKIPYLEADRAAALKTSLAAAAN